MKIIVNKKQIIIDMEGQPVENLVVNNEGGQEVVIKNGRKSVAERTLSDYCVKSYNEFVHAKTANQ